MSALPAQWQDWSDCRPGARVLHLDSAAAGRMSLAVRQAVTEHLDREARTGAYTAEAEAGTVLAEGRTRLAGLFGLPPEGLAFVESATAGLAALLRAWPLPEGATVGVVASEWGPNLQAFRARGIAPVELAAEPGGRIDLDALARTLHDAPPTLVHLTQVASHRGLVQPVGQAAALCRAAGVPLWVDAAQALGHVDTATAADAVYAVSRKWLAGPRGVGLVGVAAPWRDRLLVERPVLAAGDVPMVHRLESHEANVAGRIGLCVAVDEYLAAGPGAVHRRLAEVGRASRAVLAGLPGWRVLEGDAAGDAAAGGAISALAAIGGADVVTTRARLLAEHAILTTVAQPARAPLELRGPLLRISPHVDCTDAELERLRDALAGG